MVENALMRKVTASVCAVALLVVTVLPVPSNNEAWDRVRYQKAYAGPEAAVLGSTPAMLLTLMGCAGVYVACHSDTEWVQNCAAVAQDFATFVNENGYANEYNCDLSQYVDSTGYNVDVQAAYDGGFYDMLQAYLNSQSASQLLADGTISSAVERPVVMSYGGYSFAASDVVPYWSEAMNYQKSQDWLDQGKRVIGYSYNSDHKTVYIHFSVGGGAGEGDRYYANAQLRTNSNTGMAYLYMSTTYVKVDLNNDGSVLRFGSGTNSNLSVYEDSSNGILYSGADVRVDGESVTAGQGVSPYAGVFNPANVSSRIADIANGAVQKVHVFTPTAEQIEAGYDYQTIMAQEIAGVNTGIEGLDNILNAILAILQTLATIASGPFAWLAQWWEQISAWWSELLGWIGDTPLGELCTTVTDWVGSTPFGDVMGDVIDGVASIPGAISTGAATVVDGVAAIPGEIAGTIQGVIDAVNAGVLDLTGAIAGIMMWVPDGWGFNAVPVVAAPDWTSTLNLDLSEKVPFCYVIRAQQAVGQMFGNFSSNRSFYLVMDIPNAGAVEFDGESVLSQNLGLTDIATTIRILATSLLCFGLLFRAYKVIERTAGGL